MTVPIEVKNSTSSIVFNRLSSRQVCFQQLQFRCCGSPNAASHASWWNCHIIILRLSFLSITRAYSYHQLTLLECRYNHCLKKEVETSRKHSSGLQSWETTVPCSILRSRRLYCEHAIGTVLGILLAQPAVFSAITLMRH